MIRLLLFILILNFSSFTQGDGLLCKNIHKIQLSYLNNHILFSKYNKTLEARTLNEFLDTLDGEKIYFLASDIHRIKRKNKNLFQDLRKGNCSNLYFIYDLYVQRIKEQIKHAQKILSKNFYIKENTSYIIDSEKRQYPMNLNIATRGMNNFLQYQVANVFMIEEDLGKSTKYVLLNLNNFYKRILTWKPNLTNAEKTTCRKNNKRRNFKTCKHHKWHSVYLNSFARSLDSHSSYLDSDDIEEFKISMELSLEGIGANLSSRFGYTVVERLILGGAAFNSGKIKVKDKILAVGSSSSRMTELFGLDLRDVVSMIRGKKRTPVYLKILREEKDKKKKVFTVKLIRSTINLREEEVAVHYVNRTNVKNEKNQIAVIKVPSFYGSGTLMQKSVTRDVKNILKHPKTKRSDAIVLDLSNNRGGSLDEAVNLTGLFFSKGNVVKQSEKYLKAKNYPTLSDTDERIFYTGNLVILVNRLSASASEIVSGTLKVYNRALIVGGDHTFGKGSVQSVEYLRYQQGAIKTTVGLYFIPNGHSTQKYGVYSDIELPSIFDIDEFGEKLLDYTLPHQKISSFKSNLPEIFSSHSDLRWNRVTPQIISKLKKLSNKRVSKNKKFKEIKKELAKLKKRKDKHSIKISEILNKKKEDKEDEEDDTNLSKKEKDKKYIARADIEEAILIALDFSFIQKQNN